MYGTKRVTMYRKWVLHFMGPVDGKKRTKYFCEEMKCLCFHMSVISSLSVELRQC